MYQTPWPNPSLLRRGLLVRVQALNYGNNRRADAFKWGFASTSIGPWGQDVQWREVEAPRLLSW